MASPTKGMSGTPTSTAAETLEAPPRSRLVLARALVVAGVLLTLVSLLAVYVKREALDQDRFRETSRELLAQPAVREQIAAEMVETLYANVDVGEQLRDQLPGNLQGLAGPIAGLSREVADRAARELLERPRVQDRFVAALSASQQQFIAVLRDDTRVLETSGGNVVLDIRPLVLELGDRFNFVSNLSERIPADSSRITILRSDELEAAQGVTRLLELIANWIWILAVAAWAAAIWLARGRRRKEVRALGIGLMLVGVLVLVVRALAGQYVVDEVAVSDSVRPAVEETWRIMTDSLAGQGWAALSVGALVALAAWLTGPSRGAMAARRGLAPLLDRGEAAWASFVVSLALILWILPLQSFRTIAVLAVAAAAGFVVLRRHVAAETPEPGPLPDVLGGLRSRLAGARDGRGEGQQRSTAEELERLAALRAAGSLTDAEYAAAKATLL